MKKIIIIIFLFSITSVLYPQGFLSWKTVGGNSNRDGYNNDFFDTPNGFDRTFNAPYSIWGMPIFTEGNRFATTRYISLSPIRASIVAFSFLSTNPVWTFGENSGVNIIMGVNNDKVYVRDFQQNGNDTIFALNADNGALVWKSRFTVERGIIWTAAFTDNGDLIIPGSGTKRIMRINHQNGDTVWTNRRIIPNTGAECMCIVGNTLYALEGSITTPKKIIAIDIGTGITKYSSEALAGDGDQEIPFTVSRNGVVYIIRDGGLLHALKDNGTGFTQLWARSVPHPVGTYSQIAIGKDSSVYIPYGRKIYRLNHQTGQAMDSSIELASSGTINPRFTIGKFGNVFVGNGASEPSQGKYFVFNSSLQSLQEIPFSFNYYCGPTPGGGIYNPHILMAGAGTEIKAKYHFIDNIKILSTKSPENFELLQNYPNPYNPFTNIEFGISKLGFVSLNVFDMLGKKVATLVNEDLNPGSYKYNFDAKGLSSGVYYYTLKVDGLSESKMMMLTK
ncbi:MAG: PQQ-binding-like beta-propeller repeat protein [Ignavibacteria bacterium]